QGLPVDVEDGAAADDLVISGPIVGGGELLKIGAGTLVLSNTGNSYGQTKIDAGVLKLGASGVLPDNNVHNNWGGGGLLDLNGFDEAINQLGGNFGIINSGAGTPTLTVGVNNGSGWNYGGKISGDLSIRKAGTGTQQLSGRASDYTGDTIVDAGTLVLNGANSADSLIGTSRLVINPSGTVDAYVNAFGSTYQNLIDINGGTLRSVGADSHLNAVSMTGGLMTGVEFRPHAAFTINASPDTAVIDVNRLNLFATITFNVADGAADPDLLISGQVTGGNELVKAGPGTMVLTNTANNYSQTKIDAGTLKLGASGVLPDNNVHNNWGGGGVLDLNGFDEAINRLGGNFAVLNSGAGTPELTVGVNNGSGWNYGGLISGDLSIRKTGTGWQQLTGNNTYTGGTTVDAGELRLSGPNDPASSVGLGTLTINAGGTVRALDHNVLGHTSAANIPPIVINGGSLIPNQYLHVADVEMTGGIIEAGPAGGAGLQTHASTFTTHGSTDPATVAARVQAAFGDVTFDVADGAADMDMIVSGDIHGGNDIFKTGAGTLHLTHANNTLTGTATVNDGTLLVDGTLHGDVDVQPGGTFSAGSQVGHAIVTSASSYTQTGTMLVELGGTAQGAEYDWIEVNGGAADVGGLLDIVLVDGFRPATHSTFDVLTATGGVTDSGITLNWDPTPLLPAQYWTHSIADLGAGAQALRLEVAAPEPSSAILAVLGLLGLAWFARRRKR
ncbi:MAG: autotransporter-associated beta strand repeat-containing protein, partial [Planctomycetes bacterium]|nr:autotransporter-associated beta strand repeat-containing protein [Planctomycetota bacterium]